MRSPCVVPEQRRHRRAVVGDPAVGVGDGDAVGRVLDERPEAGAACADLLGGPGVLRLDEAPRRDVGGAGGEDEERVDEGPQQGLVLGGLMIEDVAGEEDAGDAVVGRDEPDRHEERDPVLVEGDQAHHDEEVEVHLDGAAGEVHEDGRRGHETGAGDAGSGAPAQARLKRGRAGEQGDESRLEKAVTHRLAPDHAEDGDPGDVQPEHDEHGPVAGGPQVGRQGSAAGERVAERLVPTGDRDHLLSSVSGCAPLIPLRKRWTFFSGSSGDLASSFVRAEDESPWPRRRRLALGGLLVVTGVLHFVVPEPYVRIIPSALPDDWARPLVYASGAAELAGGVGLLVAPTSAVGWFVAALFGGRLPGERPDGRGLPERRDDPAPPAAGAAGVGGPAGRPPPTPPHLSLLAAGSRLPRRDPAAKTVGGG